MICCSPLITDDGPECCDAANPFDVMLWLRKLHCFAAGTTRPKDNNISLDFAQLSRTLFSAAQSWMFASSSGQV